QHSITGWLYYFPIAMLVKSPIALIFSAVVSLALGMILLARRWGEKKKFDPAKTWTVLCLLVPPAIYLLSAMRSNLNLGLRHVLPVYPFIYIGIGLAASYVWKRHPRLAKITLLVLALGLAIESLAAFPDYIPFFNAAAGGKRGG